MKEIKDFNMALVIRDNPNSDLGGYAVSFMYVMCAPNNVTLFMV